MTVECLDVSVGGELIRVVTSGLPKLTATSPAEMLAELRRDHEPFRRSIIEPPNGHKDLYACLLFKPTTHNANAIVVVAPQIGYVPLAGTPLMAAASALVAEASNSETTVVPIDTAKGTQNITIRPEGADRFLATWTSSQPTVLAQDTYIQVEGHGTVPIRILSIGLPYLVVDARAAALEIDDPACLSEFAQKAIKEASRKYPLEAFGVAADATTYSMEVWEPAETSGMSRPMINARWIGADGWIAPSPAGTGAVAAAHHYCEQVDPDNEIALDIVGPSGELFSYSAIDGLVELTVPVQFLRTTILSGEACI